MPLLAVPPVQALVDEGSTHSTPVAMVRLVSVVLIAPTNQRRSLSCYDITLHMHSSTPPFTKHVPHAEHGV